MAVRGNTVRCVGSRHDKLSRRRTVVEHAGGRCAPHDGGQDGNPRRCDGAQAGADRVIGQAGGISHTAYWRVRAFRTRTGTPCLYMEHPGATVLAHSLRQAIGDNARG